MTANGNSNKKALAEQTSHDLEAEIAQLEKEIQERRNKLHALKLQRGPGYYLRREAGLEEKSYP